MKKLLKHTYDAVPLKKELFTLMKRFWVPSESVYRHLHFKGVFKVQIDSSHSFFIQHHGYQIENEIFWGGLEHGHENLSISLWAKLARQANVIFDIGANTGVYSLIA